MLLPFFLLFVGAIFSDGGKWFYNIKLSEHLDIKLSFIKIFALAYGFQDKKSDRIVGGRRVSVVSLPYQVSIIL